MFKEAVTVKYNNAFVFCGYYQIGMAIFCNVAHERAIKSIALIIYFISASVKPHKAGPVGANPQKFARILIECSDYAGGKPVFLRDVLEFKRLSQYPGR